MALSILLRMYTGVPFGNPLPLSERPKTQRPKLYGLGFQPTQFEEARRSIPQGIEPSFGRTNYVPPREQPVKTGHSGMDLMAASEPENLPTLEPESRF
jgi:hypothetical protein